ncbi:2,3-diaminopropionate biosynthesis protein SbnB [Paenibacillus sp. J31TS4]|uniref:2,3-diaminopropionate biosynthesis protein SbnB n=1 Tax=Paenibacillus sp. J31TS4 TaxID=2807195 RepID=UPI001B2B1560|nr:2,3-diaminopropionate biosynthesis protein SbnB [Paenibacillus sp. J31TS4]GIP38563.1 2,3-diaminopropionate biosynthesis protein SbnB [Paenibacillus sp. J31TS4]
MLYLNEGDLRRIGIEWEALADTLEETVRLMDAGDYAQPIKPYLRYRDPVNRIIAMPAYIGGRFEIAGIKWIASFPGNLRRGLPRAHSVAVLNDAGTGEPVAIVNTALLSVVRTASVSALFLRHYLRSRPGGGLTVGIIGWGPIGRHHYRMCMDLYGERIEKVYLYDLNGIDLETIAPEERAKVTVASGWQDVYDRSDLFLTCTVSEQRYVDAAPKPGRLLLHVSLRDYLPEALQGIGAIIVDDWDEVCRDGTDIEQLHKQYGLRAQDTLSLRDVVCRDALGKVQAEEPVLFSPMGLAAFDIATADYYVRRAQAAGIGTRL